MGKNGVVRAVNHKGIRHLKAKAQKTADRNLSLGRLFLHSEIFFPERIPTSSLNDFGVLG